MSVATFTKAGVKATTPAKLDKAFFSVEVANHELLKEAYVAYLSETRTRNAVTKKRGEVRGGGRKPWRQKGTGRARFGSSRNPIWRGGGVAFGPSGEQSYVKKINSAKKQKALRQALTLAAESDKVIIIEDFALKEAKTKLAGDLLAKIGATGKVLLVDSGLKPEIYRAVANLPNVVLRTPVGLNTFEVLNCDQLVFTKTALESLGSKPAKETKDE